MSMNADDSRPVDDESGGPGTGPDAAGPDGAENEAQEAGRSLWHGLISLVILGALVVGLLALWLAGRPSVQARWTFVVLAALLVPTYVDHTRRIDIDFDLEARKRESAWQPPAPRYRTGVMAKYAAAVSSASLSGLKAATSES